MAGVPEVTDSNGEKLAKFLARCGVGSRRKCEEFILVGWVQVDGKTVTSPETRIDPDGCKVSFRNQEISPPGKHRYILLHKPAGIVCTSKPGRERGKTVLDLVKITERVFNIGRLDKDTSGLLLLTNDGELTQKLTHPSFEKEKEYLVTTSSQVSSSHFEKLKEGVQLEDGPAHFKDIERIAGNKLKVILVEGRKRQIRRMLTAVGLSVKLLHRTRIASLTLDDLSEGNWRDLTPKEVRGLKSV